MDPLNEIMGTEEAAKQWGLTQDHIKRLCREGKVRAKLIGRTWIIDKGQPNPRDKRPHVVTNPLLEGFEKTFDAWWDEKKGEQK